MSRKKGDFYEKIAVKYLKRKGFKILEKNYRDSGGEIDIIAKHGKEIVFVEVRGRGKNNIVSPEETVNSFKMKKIIKTAMSYLNKRRKEFEGIRFDVISITGEGKELSINHISSAFDLQEAGFDGGKYF